MQRTPRILSEEENSDQVKETDGKATDAKLGPTEASRTVMHFDLGNAKSPPVSQHGNVTVKHSVDAHFAHDL